MAALGAITSLLVSGTTFAWSAIKILNESIFGDSVSSSNKSYDYDDDDDEISLTQTEINDILASQRKNGNSWNKFNVSRGAKQYKDASPHRLVNLNQTYNVVIISGIVAIVSIVVLYIMSSKFRRVLHGGVKDVTSNIKDLDKSPEGGSRLTKFLKSKPVIIIAIIVALGVLIYIGIRSVWGVNHVLLIKDCTPKTQTIKVKSNRIKMPENGLAWSYNMWVYIIDWEYNSGKDRVFLSKDGSIKMSLGKENPTVNIKVNVDVGEDNIEISRICEDNGLCTDGLDIERWNMLTVTFKNKTIKFYHNGKLIMGRRLKGIPILGDKDLVVGKIEGSPGTFDGRIKNLKYFKKELDLGDIEKLYKNKPT